MNKEEKDDENKKDARQNMYDNSMKFFNINYKKENGEND